MAYQFGDNPACVKRSRKITKLLIDEAAEVAASGPAVLLEDVGYAHQLLGWWVFVNRQADVLMRSYDSGFTVEAAGLMRSLIEHAHFMEWLAEHKTEGMWALEAAEWGRRKKLIEDMARIGWEIPDEIKIGDKPVFNFPDLAVERRHRTLLGQATNVSNLVEARSLKNLYPVYRYLSSHSHASLQTGEAFVQRDHGEQRALYATGKVSVDANRVWIPVCLYLAGTAVSKFLVGDPMKKHLEKAAKDVGFGVRLAERVPVRV
ncbi:DUF5677 domain-containing protein [Streptomyces sp. BE303]|uniref:DUF5677 domain-containing protein n=1 Tax=Streptomyces sp. BE303 TaxID=3002528 RepID=UPI002E794609|nr:DUF5677 domain-containing protein [Streptomyces sp. BE303]MED7949317.1 DUF5677 domain-containing protein [Streptomyces sp. BE303]